MKFIMQSVKFGKLSKLLEHYYTRCYIDSVFIRVGLYYIALYLEVLISMAK